MKQTLLMIFFVAVLLPTATPLAYSKSTNKECNMENKNYYCEYCGHKFPSVRLLASGRCPRHPDDPNKDYHKLYEGTEKKEYTCKYCGRKFPSIMVMVGGTCAYHPKGAHKGGHAPAL